MAIRVLMKRVVKGGNRRPLHQLLRELRTLALTRPGYISGETLVSMNQPGTGRVISTWSSSEAWQAYENVPERRAILEVIDELLVEPRDTTIWVPDPTHNA